MINTEEQVSIREDNNQTLDEYFGSHFLEEFEFKRKINEEDSSKLMSILSKYVQVGTNVCIETKLKFKEPKYGLIALYEISVYESDKITNVYDLIQREDGFYIYQLKHKEIIEQGKRTTCLSQDKKGENLGNNKESVIRNLERILFN